MHSEKTLYSLRKNFPHIFKMLRANVRKYLHIKKGFLEFSEESVERDASVAYCTFLAA